MNLHFEQFANEHGVQLQSFRADDHPFQAQAFLDDLESQDQTITCSGVGAHHQAGVAERGIKTVTSWALSFLMHQMLHWPDQFDEALWPFALEHAATIWNHLPKASTGLSPYELFTGSKLPYNSILLNARVWGCPAFTLNPKLQDGRKLPKWHMNSCQGMHLGASPDHSPTVRRILNLRTGVISPQCHVMHDELFSAVQGSLTESDKKQIK